MALVPAYEKKSGDKRLIPEHWLGHPTLGKDFVKTPPAKGGGKAADAASTKTPVVGDTKKEK